MKYSFVSLTLFKYSVMQVMGSAHENISILAGFRALMTIPHRIGLGLKNIVPLSISAISNNSGLSIQSNCSRTQTVRTSCTVGSRRSPTKSDPFSWLQGSLLVQFHSVKLKHFGVSRHL